MPTKEFEVYTYCKQCDDGYWSRKKEIELPLQYQEPSDVAPNNCKWCGSSMTKPVKVRRPRNK